MKLTLATTINKKLFEKGTYKNLSAPHSRGTRISVRVVAFNRMRHML